MKVQLKDYKPGDAPSCRFLRVRLQGLFSAPPDSAVADEEEGGHVIHHGGRRYVPIIVFREMDDSGNMGAIIAGDLNDLFELMYYNDEAAGAPLVEEARIANDGTVID